MIEGKDEQGNFSNERSFEEFDLLVQALKASWPGCYIPQIPGHKLIQLKNESVLADRCHLLHIFYQDCAKIPYIYNSEEFRDFGRANIDYAKVYKE